MSTEENEVSLQELGWCSARLFKDHVLDEKGNNDFLLIFSPSSISEMVSTPPMDVRISGMKNITKLRDFLNQAYPK